MGRKPGKSKFDQISALYPRFSEKNRERLVKTAQDLLKIQHENAALLAEAGTRRRREGLRCTE
jgi:hypothetical protein